MQIESPDGDPDAVEITAIEVNRTKWTFVDGTVPTVEEADSSRVVFYLATTVQRPRNLQIRVEEIVEGLRATRAATIWFDRPENSLVRRAAAVD
jgi:hypothetical protein